MTIDSAFPGMSFSNRTSWADLVAYCYTCIGELQIPEGTFLHRYCDHAQNNLPGAHENPNLGALRELAKTICDTVSEEMRLHSISRKETFEAISLLVESLNLKPYKDDACNNATKYWAVINGIDMAYRDSFSSLTFSKRGPLNSEYASQTYGVYLRPIDSIIMQRYQEAKILRIPEDQFNNRLNSLLILKYENDRTPPIIKLVKRSPLQKENPESERIRIALCLFSGSKLLSFDNNDLPITPESAGGSDYRIKYRDSFQDQSKNIAIAAIEQAIDADCDLVVFPEYVMPPETQNALSTYLKSSNAKRRLALVVAGSGWTTDDNNVCTLYDSRGKTIGKYYKYSNYIDDNGLYHEALSNPGAECTLVDIEGLGRVLPSICKDIVSSQRYTADLALSLYPQLICAPAFSGSLERAFVGPLRSAAVDSLCIGCVCNCCGARIPRKNGTIKSTVACVPRRSFNEDGRQTKQATDELLTTICDIETREKCIATFNDGETPICLKVLEIDFSDPVPGVRWPNMTFE